MKKTIFITLIRGGGMFTVNVQENEPHSTTNFNKWQVRLLAIAIVANEFATIKTIRRDTKISSGFVPELDFIYFFNKNLAAELILGTAKHDVDAISTIAGGIPLGDVWLLPPALALQYHLDGDVVGSY